ncbi:MAG: hypothetical protein KJ600_02325 [Nanoarchaeota archaeon]|nr:hypothetical protein [Nanoarchaeota archaeon]MBU1103371.1 hypothetical protein [Nanoarchaeota archaeon]
MVFGSIADIFFQWEHMGVFDYILPFLLVFALVFGILNATRFLGESKGIYAIIALVIGFMSLRYQYLFSDFISELFPRLGVGLAILLSIMILVGLFIEKDYQKYWAWGLSALGFVIALVIFYQTTTRMGWYWGGYGSEAVGFIVLAVLIVGVIIAVAASGGKDDGSKAAKSGAEAIFGPWRK